LFLKGERCLSPKCAIERRNTPPGMHGKKAAFRRKASDFGMQLREKQKARQLVRHGHFSLNGRRTNIPSATVKIGDVISVHPSSRSTTYFRDRSQMLSGVRVPQWLSLDAAALSGSVLNSPAREDIEIPLNEQLIVEFYSR
jgi:small subunit ribosomal protein S4